jgi:hypothetical protein
MNRGLRIYGMLSFVGFATALVGINSSHRWLEWIGGVIIAASLVYGAVWFRTARPR